MAVAGVVGMPLGGLRAWRFRGELEGREGVRWGERCRRRARARMCFRLGRTCCSQLVVSWWCPGGFRFFKGGYKKRRVVLAGLTIKIGTEKCDTVQRHRPITSTKPVAVLCSVHYTL